MDPIQQITISIAPTLEDMGYELVRVSLSGGQKPTLQVMAERIDRRGMTVDDCAEISRAVSVLLDVDDPIPTAYQLEVSSPGIDRPLVRREDFVRFVGFEARVETDRQIDGQRRFRGRLLGFADDDLCLELPDGEHRIPFASIKKAKLVLTDELLAAAQAEGKD